MARHKVSADPYIRHTVFDYFYFDGSTGRAISIPPTADRRTSIKFSADRYLCMQPIGTVVFQRNQPGFYIRNRLHFAI